MCHPRGHLAFLAFLALALSAPVLAGEPEKGAERPALDEIVVTARRLWDYLKDRLRSIAPITGTTREEFQKRPNTRRLGDVIDRLPGVFMGGPPNMNKDIRLRGLDKEFTRLEFGGAQIPDVETSRAFQVNRLSPFSVERLTILRNPTAEYESDGIAGRVLVTPRDIPEKLRVEMEGSGGGVNGLDRCEFGKEIGSFRLGIGDRVNPHFGYNLFADWQRSPMENNKDKWTYNPSGALTKREAEDHFLGSNIYNLFLDLAYYYGRGEIHVRPFASILDEKSHRTLLRYQLGKADEMELPVETKRHRTEGLTITHRHTFENDLTLESDLSYYVGREDKRNVKPTYKAKAGSFVLDKTAREETENEDAFWQFRTKLIAPFKLWLPQELRTGLVVRPRDRSRTLDKVEIKPNGTVTDKGASSDDFRLREDYFAFFVQDTIFFTPRLSLTPGVRIERVLLDAKASDGTSRSETLMDVNPTLHLLYRATDHWSFHAAASRTVNRPMFDQLVPFADNKGSYYLLGNPALQPAKSCNFDLGTIYATDRLLLGLNLFRKQIKGLIEEVDTGAEMDGMDVHRYENTGDGWLQGIELEQRLDCTLLHERLAGLELWANQTFLRSRVREPGGETRPINNQPRFLTSLGLDYTLRPTRTSFGVAARYVGDLVERADNGVRKVERAKWTLDLNVRQKAGKNAEFFAEALNVLDAGQRRYTYTNGQLTEHEDAYPGRALVVGFRVAF